MENHRTPPFFSGLNFAYLCELFGSFGYFGYLRLNLRIKQQNLAMKSGASSWCHIIPRKGAQWQKALDFLSLSMERSMQATIITYSASISACEKGGKWREARVGVSLNLSFGTLFYHLSKQTWTMDMKKISRYNIESN